MIEDLENADEEELLDLSVHHTPSLRDFVDNAPRTVVEPGKVQDLAIASYDKQLAAMTDLLAHVTQSNERMRAELKNLNQELSQERRAREEAVDQAEKKNLELQKEAKKLYAQIEALKNARGACAIM